MVWWVADTNYNKPHTSPASAGKQDCSKVWWVADTNYNNSHIAPASICKHDRIKANDCNKVWRLLGVVYEGALKDGKFHGKGTLNYPSGCCISGVWDNGVLQSTSFHFSDGLSFRNVESWKYCKIPDRRFYKEHLLGLRPAGLSHLTQDTPTRPIPEGCYDVGDGFYDPRTKCVTDPEDGRITRVPTAAEEDWIMANCRKAWDQPQGYRPDLYENWWSEQGCKAGDQEEEEDLQ
uniref:MORN repeat-containing protein 5 n=1 Tax=Timema douglasi TaxID=61478 RepID=A0A7R8VMT1_TIMDO|nr:unnamed protein product [Timema douglasi]